MHASLRFENDSIRTFLGRGREGRPSTRCCHRVGLGWVGFGWVE